MGKKIRLDLKVPEYLTIDKYCKMNSYKGQSKFGKLCHAVSVLTGEELPSVREWDLESLTRVSNIYAAVADHKELFHPIIEWNGELYGYSNIKQCSLGEYIDLETYSQDMENSMHKVAAILYRPIKKHRFNDILFSVKQGVKTAINKVDNAFEWYELDSYDSKVRKQQEEKMKEFPVHLFLGAISFFLSTASLYLNNIQYLTQKITKKQMMETEEAIMTSLLVNTGGGTQHFSNSLKPIYYKLQEINA